MNDDYTNEFEPEEGGFTPDEPEVHDTIFAEDGTYRIVRPEAERDDRSYTDASFHTAEEAADVPPRYYTPDPPRARAKQQPEQKKNGFWRVACLALACAVLGGAAGSVVTGRMLKDSSAAVETTAPTDTAETGQKNTFVSVEPVAAGSMSAGEIYAEACQQVVGISTEITVQNIFGQTSSSAVTGSGFIISADGYILTNNHVIEYAAKGGYAVTVMTYDGTEYAATIVGTDAANDIAVLKIDAEGLTPATFGDSDAITVGDTVYAVGNPLGELQFSMTTGHVSALDRTITTENNGVAINMFQIDAAVNSGNSGGPVYNAAGQVIGIVTAKYSSSGVEGLGFAIPVNDAVNIANELMENGIVMNKVMLGITTQTVEPSVAQYYNMVVGAYVYSVNEGSCAEKAGLQVGDIITKVGDKEVSSSDALKAALRSYAPGDETELTIYRAGKTETLTVVLDEATDAVNTPVQPAQQP